MKILYAVSVCCLFDGRTRTKVRHAILLTEAESSDVAEAKAVELAEKQWPPNHGWEGHQATSVEIGQELMLAKVGEAVLFNPN